MESHPNPRGVIKRDHVRVEEGPVRSRPRPTPSGSACAGSPRVRLVDVDASTQAFEFTCACGEVSLIEIQYEKKS